MIFLTIIFVVFVSASEIDVCIPSFSQIQKIFNLSPFKTELLLGLNLIFHCFAAFFSGSLGDHYGKKKMINAGMFLLILGSLLCYFANSYLYLALGRVIQGIGIAAPLVLTPILIMDFYEKDEQQKRMNILNGVCTLGLCSAPIIGSYTTLLFGWKFNFLLIGLLGAAAFILSALFIPPPIKRALEPKSTYPSLREYTPLFQSKILVHYLVCLCSSIGVYYTFIGMAPLIYIESLGVHLKSFGLYQGSLTFTFGILSILGGFLVKKIGKKISFFSSFFLIFLFSVSCCFITFFNIKNPLLITGAMLLLSVGCVIPMNLIYVLSLDLIPGVSGKISALITIGKWIFTTIGIQFSSYFYSNDFRSTGVALLLMQLISFYSGFFIFKKDEILKKELRS